MGIQFDWEIRDEDDNENIPPQRPLPKWTRYLWVIIPIILITAPITYIYLQFADSERQLRAKVQDTLDFEQQAFDSGDGELYLSMYDEADLSFRFTQLRPEFQASQAAGLNATKVEQHDGVLWANLEWNHEGETLQRIAFFRKTVSGLIHVATDSNYWGKVQRSVYPWGRIDVTEADLLWEAQFASVVTDTVATHRGNAVPLAIVIRDDFLVATSPHTVYYPSPRLVGLNANGEPSAEYWRGFQKAIEAHIAPVTIRFALPDSLLTGGQTIFIERAAREFEAQYPEGRITVELVTAETLEGDSNTWLPAVDGAAIAATEALIKSGGVRDLTPFVSLDRAFDRGDYYAQPWRAAWWQDRMWYVPSSTSVSLLYVNAQMFTSAGLTVPQPDWTWEQVEAILPALTLQDEGDRPLIDPMRDMVYALAYSLDKNCEEQVCTQPITTASSAAALEWYRESVVDNNISTDLGGITPQVRFETVMGTLSAHKQIAMWVGSPVDYEYQVGLQKTEVLPFLDFSAETPIQMPLRIQGHVMSNYTEQPYWTWQWLKFLSYQEPPTRSRQIPARPSVTRQSGFWEWLPTPIADVYKQVLPSGRPILIGEENYFSWEQLDRVTTTNQVDDVIAQPIKTTWFYEP